MKPALALTSPQPRACWPTPSPGGPVAPAGPGWAAPREEVRVQNFRRHRCQSGVTAGRPPSMRAPQTFCPEGPLLPPRTQQSRWCTGKPLELLLPVHPTGLKPPYLQGLSKTPSPTGPSPSTHQLPCPLLGIPPAICSWWMKNSFPRQLYVAPFHVDTPYLPSTSLQTPHRQSLSFQLCAPFRPSAALAAK